MTKTLFFLSAFFSLLLSCAFSQYGPPKLSAIDISYGIPSKNPLTGESISIVDSISIFYMGNDVLVRERYTHTEYNQKAMKDGVFVVSEDKSTISKRERRYRYYLYSSGSTKGLRYDSLKATVLKPFDVDSLLKKKMFSQMKLYDSSNDVFVKSEKKGDGRVLDTYVPKVKFDESYNDTTYFVFDPKFKDVPFSLSKEADSLKKMKMVEARLVYKALPKSQKNPDGVPEREFWFRMKELKISNPQEIEGLFRKFDSQKRSLESIRG